MKDPLERTKVVVRHLPPGITQSALFEEIDGRFAGCYQWLCFRPGKNSVKNQCYARAYINFKRHEDVVEFAEFFDGHVFVNEKGTQFKATIEYAPSQRVPKLWSKKDGREGTIFKDPEYLKFLELLSKPIENLPSAEIQLEKKEAERAGVAKEALIVTPLMDFVRQKRAAKHLPQRSSANGKHSQRAEGASWSSLSPASSKRGSEKRRLTTSMYVSRGNLKNARVKEKAIILMSRREQKQHSDKSVAAAASGIEALEESVSGDTGAEKRRHVLLKGKERDISQAPVGSSQQQAITLSKRSSSGRTSFKQIPRHEESGRIIRNILSKEAREPEQHLHTQNLEKGKRPPRPSNVRLVTKGHISNISDGDKRSLSDRVTGSDLHGSVLRERKDKHAKNKDRPDRGVWTPLRRSDGSLATDESLSSSASLNERVLSESLNCMSISQSVSMIKDGNHGQLFGGSSSFASPDMSHDHEEMKDDMTSAIKIGEARILVSRKGSYSLSENGFHRHGGRRGLKEADSSTIISEVKQPKRGFSGYSSHEKQIWVQKAGSGS